MAKRLRLREDARIVVVRYGGARRALLEIADDEGVARLYGAEDWAAECGASFVRDEDGDVREVDGRGDPGRHLRYGVEPCSDGAALKLLRATWKDLSGVFR